jgi:uncharacterized membrane protein
MSLFTVFLIVDLIIILLSLPMLFIGRVRWARLAALLPIGFGLISLAIGIYAHAVSPFAGYRLALALIFAAAITAFICLLTARLLLSIGPKPPAR